MRENTGDISVNWKCKDTTKTFGWRFLANQEKSVDPTTTEQTGKGSGGWNWPRTFFRNNEKYQSGGSYFGLNEPKPCSGKEKPSTPEQNTNEPEPVSGTEENEVAKSSPKFAIVDLKDDDTAEKASHYIQVNHVIVKLETKSAETEEDLKKAEFIFMIDLKNWFTKFQLTGKYYNWRYVSAATKKIQLPKNSLHFSAELPTDSVCCPPGTGFWLPTSWKDRWWPHYVSDTRAQRRCLRKAAHSCGLEWRKTLKTGAAHAPNAWISVRI